MLWFRVAPPVGNTAPLLPQAGMLPWPQVARQLAALTSSPALRHAATKGILVAMACTFFEAFNVPVFWPILVMYFIMLFCITMKRQIKVSAGGVGAESPARVLTVHQEHHRASQSLGPQGHGTAPCRQGPTQMCPVVQLSPPPRPLAPWGPGGRGPRVCHAGLIGTSSWGLRAQGPPASECYADITLKWLPGRLYPHASGGVRCV